MFPSCLMHGVICVFMTFSGQEVHARRFMNEARENGTWVLFQNCHLSLLFMDEVYNYIQVIYGSMNQRHEPTDALM